MRRLLRLLVAPVEQQGVGLHWSRWRRKRQAEARRSHYKHHLARSTLELPL